MIRRTRPPGTYRLAPQKVNGEYVLSCPDCGKTFRDPDRFVAVTDFIGHHALRCDDPALIDRILNSP